MPHMSNLPWTLFYFLINLSLIIFMTKENFLMKPDKTTKNSKMSETPNMKIPW